MSEDEEDKEIFEGEIEYKVKVKVVGDEPVITDLKKIVEDGLFESGDGLYRVTSITSDKELEDLKKQMEDEDEDDDEEDE